MLSWLRSTLSRPLLQGQLLPSEHVPTLCGAALCALAPVQGRLDSGTIGILEVVFVVTFLVISLALHEAAHAWVAWKCGDPTAKDLGRITLNPIASIDPFLSVILPGALMLMGQPPFGGAKPVPVSYHRLRHPLRDMMFVALAGPVTNFLLSIVFLVALKAAYTFGDYRSGDLMFGVLQYAVFANLMLTVFNLLPVPPLDGSRVMAWLLPSGLREPYQDLERFGMLLVVGIMAAMNYIPGLRRAVWDGALTLFDAIDFLTGGLW